MSQRDYSNVIVESGGLVHQGDFITNTIFQNPTHQGLPSDPKLLLRDALAYDGAFARDEHLSTRLIPPKSLQWIWSTPLRKWLSRKSDRLYWITGKPGSGKSTLIHYLAHADKTRKHLCSSGQQYKIVKFFFDCRAGDSTANSERGLIKCALSQLCNAFPDIEKHLAGRNLHDSLKEKNTTQLLEVFCSVLDSIPNPICAFIDGLDEYTGNYVGLVTFLTTLQDRTSIKLCLGSRPETAFRTAYGKLPSLAMQDHNSDAIEAYIDYAIKNARDSLVDVDAVIDSAVRKELHDRAHGVMIWLRLATDELVKAAATGVGRARISEILEDIPEDLEQMYDHTFLRISPKDAHEAALFLFLINELDGAVDLQVLHGLWSFYEADFLENQQVNVLISQESFEKRLHALIGSFIDVVDKKWGKNPHRSLLRYTRTLEASYMRPISFLSDKARELKFWSKSSEVRLIHETLRSFLRRSKSVQPAIPLEVRLGYPENAKSRVYADVIAAASDARYYDLDNIADPYQTDNEEQNSYPVLDAHIKILTRVVNDKKWKLRINALIHCVTGFPQAAHELQLPCAPIFSTWHAAMKSSLMFLELQKRTVFPRYAEDLFRRYDEFIDLRLAVEYGLPQYISDSNKLGVSASPRIWYELLEDIALLSQRYRLKGFSEVLRPLNQNLHGFQGDMKSSMALVSLQCSAIPSKFLSSIGKSMMEWKYISRKEHDAEFFLQLIYFTLTSMSSLPIVDNSVTEPPKCDYARKDCLSAMWAHSSHYLQYLPSRSYRYDVCSKLERLLAKIIHENNDDNVVNNVCERHGTALHALVDTVYDHAWEPISPDFKLSTLIALARLGADPKIQHLGKTPLQLLEGKMFPYIKYLTEIAAPEIIKILRHHKIKGSWPKFEPIIKRYKLSGPALWEFDDHRRIVLGPVPAQKVNRNRTVQNDASEMNHARIQDSMMISAVNENVNENHQPSLVEEHFMSGGLDGPSELDPVEQLVIADGVTHQALTTEEHALSTRLTLSIEYEAAKTCPRCGTTSELDWFYCCQDLTT